MTTESRIYLPERNFQFISDDIDLSEPTQIVPIFYHGSLEAAFGNFQTNCVAVLKGVFVIYTEATSADVGTGLKLGKPTDSNQFWEVTTSINKPLWDVDYFPSTDPTINNDRILTSDEDVMLVQCDGNKSGTGKVRVGIIISLNYKDAKEFSAN